MKPTNLHLIHGTQHDRADGAHKLCRDFKVPIESETRLLDLLAYCDAERFKIPYAAGAELATKRPFGIELRALANSPNLTPKRLFALDHVTCDEAGMLELLDRLGIDGMFEALDPTVAGTGRELPVSDMPERVAPVAHEHALPLMREAIATFINDEIGLEASARRDFKKKGGEIVAVPGRMADFIIRALALAGWDFTAAEVAGNYRIVLLKREWTRHPRPKPRPGSGRRR